MQPASKVIRVKTMVPSAFSSCVD